MAVQIPRLQRVQPSRSIASAGRVQQQAQPQAQSVLNRTQALGNLAQTGADIYQEFENDKINQLSQKAEQEYTIWNNQKLLELKSHQGDPTDAYAQYETEAQEKYDEIINANPDVPERVKRGVQGHLNKVTQSQRIQALKQRGAQVETYEHNLFESTVKLRKNNLTVSSGYIRKDDPGSFLPFEENLADIKTAIAKRGMDKGTAEKLPDDAESWDHIYRDEEGKFVKVKMTDISKQRAAVELSDGVTNSIKALLANPDTQGEAQAAYERYKGYIDTKSRATIENKFKTADTKDSAYKFIGSLRGKSQEERLQAINDISDPELRSEALKIEDADSRRLENLRERKVEKNYDVLADHVLQKMNSDNPYHGLADLENDQVYGETWDNLDSKRKKAIQDMVKQPERTNPQSEARVQNLFFGNDESTSLDTISPTKFQEYLTGLSSSDRNKYMGMFNRMRVQSAGQERSMYKRAESYLEDQLILDRHVSRDDYGKISGRDERKFIEARNELIDHLSTQTGTFSDKDLKDFVKSYSASKIKGEVFSPEPRAVFSSQAASQRQAPQNEITLSPRELRNFKKQYREQYGYFPTTDEEKFKNFVERNR